MLANDGYFVVRSAGSFGVADIVAIKKANDGYEIRLIQSKTNKIDKKEFKLACIELSKYGLDDLFEMWIYKAGKFEIVKTKKE